MQKIITILLVLVLTTAFLAVPAQASRQGPPIGSCPPGFMLHSVMQHEGDHHHDHHVGLEFDLNQDGYICVMHIANHLHVHMDNVIK